MELTDILGLLGYLLRALGFLIFGFGLARFVLDAYGKATWQTQVALAIGFMGLLVGLTEFASPGASGMYALGAGVALVMNMVGNKSEKSEE